MAEQEVRALVAALNKRTATSGRRAAVLAELDNPTVNKWATAIRYTFDDYYSEASGRLGNSTGLFERKYPDWDEAKFPHKVFVHDARVFVNNYRAPERRRERRWRTNYIDTVYWSAKRGQWELPYQHNEHLSQSELMMGDPRYLGERDYAKWEAELYPMYGPRGWAWKLLEP